MRPSAVIAFAGALSVVVSFCAMAPLDRAAYAQAGGCCGAPVAAEISSHFPQPPSPQPTFRPELTAPPKVLRDLDKPGVQQRTIILTEQQRETLPSGITKVTYTSSTGDVVEEYEIDGMHGTAEELAAQFSRRLQATDQDYSASWWKNKPALVITKVAVFGLQIYVGVVCGPLGSVVGATAEGGAGEAGQREFVTGYAEVRDREGTSVLQEAVKNGAYAALWEGLFHAERAREAWAARTAIQDETRVLLDAVQKASDATAQAIKNRTEAAAQRIGERLAQASEEEAPKLRQALSDLLQQGAKSLDELATAALGRKNAIMVQQGERLVENTAHMAREVFLGTGPKFTAKDVVRDLAEAGGQAVVEKGVEEAAALGEHFFAGSHGSEPAGPTPNPMPTPPPAAPSSSNQPGSQALPPIPAPPPAPRR